MPIEQPPHTTSADTSHGSLARSEPRAPNAAVSDSRLPPVTQIARDPFAGLHIPQHEHVLSIVESSGDAPSPLTHSSEARGLRHRVSLLLTPCTDKPTGLEHLPLPDFLSLAADRGAFSHAKDPGLATGNWSALVGTSLLKCEEAKPLRAELESIVRGGSVLEIGPGESINIHRKLTMKMGATGYVGVDLRPIIKGYGGIHSDVLEYLGTQSSHSIRSMCAFGVFNEPMSLHFPHGMPRLFWLPASTPERAGRRHCEHEYVRRLAREIVRVLEPGGVLFGDGLFSRTFETEVALYLTREGLLPRESSYAALKDTGLPFLERHGVRQPFFLATPNRSNGATRT